MKNEGYPQIVSLSGADRVRKRPAVIFGSTDIDGAIAAVSTLINMFITEASYGFSKKIDIMIHKDNSISIHSFDRGMILDNTVLDGKPLWYYHFCELYCGPRAIDENYLSWLEDRHTELYGASGDFLNKYQPEFSFAFDLCCVQYVSKYMHVETTRDGIRGTLDFEKGHSVSDLSLQSVNEPSNTYIRFLLDSEVFEVVNIPAASICGIVKDAALSVPGLRCNISDKRDNSFFSYFYPRGSEDYISSLTVSSIPLYVNEMECLGKDRYNRKEYSAWVKVTFAFSDDISRIECLHNFRTLKCGGQHLGRVKKKIAEYVNGVYVSELHRHLREHNMDVSNEDLMFDFEDLANHIILIIETKCSPNASSYENGTRQSISNQMIVDMTGDLINQDFAHYLNQNKNVILPILLRSMDKEKCTK